MSLSTAPMEKALQNLSDALSLDKPTELERDGTIQRFEYCYELLWKLAQRTLKQHEIEAETPKSVFRELGRLNWIDNVEDWLNFQKMRNQTSHEYGQDLADHSYQLAKQFLPLATKLLHVLKEKNV